MWVYIQETQSQSLVVNKNYRHIQTCLVKTQLPSMGVLMRPVKILVFNATYNVCYVPALELDGDPIYGSHCFDTKTITVMDNTHEVNVKDTLFHEVMHAVALEYSIDFTDEENMTDLYSKAIVKTFSDNPDLVKYLGFGK